MPPGSWEFLTWAPQDFLQFWEFHLSDISFIQLSQKAYTSIHLLSHINRHHTADSQKRPNMTSSLTSSHIILCDVNGHYTLKRKNFGRFKFRTSVRILENLECTWSSSSDLDFWSLHPWIFSAHIFASVRNPIPVWPLFSMLYQLWFW